MTWIVDATSGDVLFEISRKEEVWARAFSSDGARLAVDGDDNKAAVVDATSGDVLFEISREGSVLALAFSSDGARLAARGRRQR